VVFFTLVQIGYFLIRFANEKIPCFLIVEGANFELKFGDISPLKKTPLI
jgi:hypothetical protein